MIQWALEENRGLRSTWEQWQASRQAIPQASACGSDDPLRLLHPGSGNPGRSPATARWSCSDLSLVWSEEAYPSMADEKSLEAWATYQTHRRELVHKIRSLWADWDYFDRATALTQDNIQLVRRLEQVAQARLRSGEDALAVVQAQLTLARLEEQVTNGRIAKSRLWRSSMDYSIVLPTPHSHHSNLPSHGLRKLGRALSRPPHGRSILPF